VFVFSAVAWIVARPWRESQRRASGRDDRPLNAIGVTGLWEF